MFQAPVIASSQLVLAGQAASTGTSGLRGSPGTAVLGLLSSPAGEKCDQLLVPAPAGAEAPGVCTVPGEKSGVLALEQGLAEEHEGLSGGVLEGGEVSAARV